MKFFRTHNNLAKKRGVVITVSVIAVIVALIVVGALGTRYWYQQQLKPLSQQSEKITVIIPSGYTTAQIGQLLKQRDVIRNATAFEWYVRNSDLRDGLKAGQYQLDSSQSVKQIALIIAQGKIQQKLFTILPSQRLDQIRAAFIKAGFKTPDVDAALNPAN